MRIAVALSLVIVLFAGCTTTTTAPPVASGNVASVRAVYDAFARGDAAALMGALDPNVVWYEAESILYADRNPYRSPQAIGEGVFGRMGADWNNFRVRVDQIIDGGDTVVALGRYSATWKATGKPLDAQFAHVWTWKNGKIVGFQQYTDTAQFARVQAR
jgi:uncharacterized protein